MNIFSRITARTMRENKTRTLVTLIGVILSTAMITAVTVFGSSIMNFLLEQTIIQEGSWHGQLGVITQEQAERLMLDERVETAAEIKEIGVAKSEYLSGLTEGLPYLDIFSLPEENSIIPPLVMTAGRLPENDRELILPAYVLEQLSGKLEIGDTISLEIGDRWYQGERLKRYETVDGDVSLEQEELIVRRTQEYTIVGAYRGALNLSNIGIGYDVFCGPSDETVSSADVYFTLRDPKKAYDFVQEWSKNLGVGSTSSLHTGLLRWLGAFRNSNFMTVYMGFVLLVIGIIVIASISLIYNAFAISLRERTAQFGLLFSIGATRKQLRRSLQYEALFVSAVGIPTGIISGIAGIAVTLRVIGRGIAVMFFDTADTIALRISWWALAAAAVLALATVLVSVWIPARRIRHISPIEAIRGTADIRIPFRGGRQESVLSRRGLERKLARKNYRRDRRKYRSTILSLTLSIVLFVSVSLLGEYVRTSAAVVLPVPKGLELSYFVYGEMSAEEKERLMAVLNAEETVQNVASYQMYYPDILVDTGILSNRTEETEAASYLGTRMVILPDEAFRQMAQEEGIDADQYLRPAEVPQAVLYDAYLYRDPDTERYEQRHTFKELPQEAIACGRVEMYYNQTTEDYEYSFTELFWLRLADSVSELPQGIVPYDENMPMLIIPQSIYEQSLRTALAEQNVRTEFAIQTSDYQRAYENLQDSLNDNNFDSEDLYNHREDYDNHRAMLLAADVLLYGFTVLISLVAIANIFNSVSTNLFMRRREFAVLRSVGMSGKTFRQMLAWEGVIYVLRSSLYGIFCSLGVSYLMYLILNEGVKANYLVPVRYIAVAVAVVLMIVFLILFYVGGRIKRTSLIDEIKVE